MKNKRLLTQILAIALCLALLCPLAAFAEDAGSYAVVDPAAMQKLVEEYADAKGYTRENIRVGYCYLDTGDTWYYNGDSWSYGAGVYYVPMMMILAEWESTGKLARDSKIQGYPLGEAESIILCDTGTTGTAVKNQVMPAIGSTKDMLEKIRDYAPSLPESYYDPDYLNVTYMSPRFLTEVLKTLYNENERFPNILECMKKRGGNEFFRGGSIGGAYEVAQMYGSFEKGNRMNNNCMGIIYTPHPFALVVMTRYLGNTEEVMRDLAIKFKDYTLTLDGKYDSWKANGGQVAAPAPVVTEPEPATVTVDEPGTEGEGEQTPTQPVIELPGQTTPVEPGTPGEGQQEPGDITVSQPEGPDAAGEQQPQEQPDQQEQQDQQEQEKQQPEKQEKTSSGRMILLLIGAAILVILFLGAILRIVKRRKDEDEYEEDEDEEDEDEEEDEDDEDLKY